MARRKADRRVGEVSGRKRVAKPRAKSAATRKPSAKRARAAKPETRGARNCRWIEEFCRVPEGGDVGKPVKLRDWQRRDICRIYDNPAGTRTAIISFGKKNGKTALASFLLLLHLCGPEAIANTQLPSTAQSKDQASILFKLAAKIVRQSPELSDCLIVRDTIKEIFCPELGTLYKALSAEASTAHGQSPIFAVHDELGQVKGPVSELYNAIENAMGAHARPMSVIISTQAPTDADLLSILIDDGLKGTDPRVVVSLYTADPDIDPFSVKALRQANPAYGDFLNETEVRGQAAKAKRMPSQEPLYRNYTLNQRVEMKSPFVAKSVWMGCAGAALSDLRGLDVFAGLDLSDTTDLTSLVLEAEADQLWHVRPTFWLPDEGLADRSLKDRVPYDQWHREGHLATTPGKSVEYEWVAEYLYGLFSELTIVKLAFDRWNFKHLKPWLIKAGFSEQDIAEHFVEFGQGFQSMSPALRDLETALLNGRIRHGGHPVLSMCAANAVVQSDPSGNRKLTKQKSRGRIDGMVALTMAHAMALTVEQQGVSVYDQIAAQQKTGAAKTGSGQGGPASSDAAPSATAIDYAALQDVNHPMFKEMARRFELRRRLDGDAD
jgi:phage terminase large subunit-like protein